MRSDADRLKAPGLKYRHNKDGTIRLHWCARSDLVKMGYEPKSVRLHYNYMDVTQHPLIMAACERLQAEMLEWSSGFRKDRRAFDGTIKGLVLAYETDPASPIVQLKYNTLRTYKELLGKIERAFGQRVLSALGIADFRRWYDEAKKPKEPGGPERLTKAHNITRMLRRLFSYGVMAELPECERLLKIMDQARFKQPSRRRSMLELHHVQAFNTVAIDAGRHSLALGTSLQFETGMRQKDVIGEWEPIPDGTAAHRAARGPVGQWTNLV